MTQELIQKAKACKTPEELLALAQENGVEMTEEQAKDYFAKLNPANGEICDEELSNVSGGGCDNQPPLKCPDCGCTTFHEMTGRNPQTGETGSIWVCTRCRKESTPSFIARPIIRPPVI